MYKIPVYKLLTVVVLIGLLAAAAASCRSTKNIRKVIATPGQHQDTTVTVTTVAPVRDLHADSIQVIHTALGNLAHHHIDFQTFSGHMHVHYQGGDGKDYEITVFVRIQKDSAIWMSIVGNVGPVTIEVFRALITRDSVKIMDKRAKVVRLRSVNYLQEQVHLPIDFNTLQNLLIGNPIFLDTAHVLYYRMETKGVMSLFSEGAAFTNFLTLNPDYTIRHSKLDDTNPLSARTGDFTYGDYDYTGPQPFSTYRKISIAEKSKVDIEIGIKQYKFNDPLNLSFPIPKNYKRR
jgi:Domain of unknown function (DUF4292)